MSEPSGSQGRPYASFGRRALAAAIDFPLAYLPVCLLAIPAALVRVAITSLFPGQGESQGLATEALRGELSVPAKYNHCPKITTATQQPLVSPF